VIWVLLWKSGRSLHKIDTIVWRSRRACWLISSENLATSDQRKKVWDSVRNILTPVNWRSICWKWVSRATRASFISTSSYIDACAENTETWKLTKRCKSLSSRHSLKSTWWRLNSKTRARRTLKITILLTELSRKKMVSIHSWL